MDHLAVEGVAAQRQAMAEDHRLTRSPILVIDLGSVLGRDRAHGSGSLSMRGYGRLIAGPAGRGGNQGQRGGTRASEKDPPAGRLSFPLMVNGLFDAHPLLSPEDVTTS